MKGMRYNEATLAVALSGTTVELINNILQRCKNRYIQKNRDFNPSFGFKFDELYIAKRLIFNPNDMSLVGITHSLDSDDFLEPIYKNANAIAQGSEDVATLLPSQASQILQITIFDIASDFSTPGPYFPTTEGTKFKHLYTFIVDQFLYPWKMITGFDMNVMLFDMSQVNQSFVLRLSRNKSFEQTIGAPILIALPFQRKPLCAMMDAVHTMKNVRNQMYNSRMPNKITLRYHGVPITWNIFIDLYEKYLSKSISLNRSLTYKAIYLDRFTKLNVPMALSIFSENTISALQAVQDASADGSSGVIGALFLAKAAKKFFVGIFVNRTKGRQNLKVKNMKHPIFQTLDEAYTDFMEWRNQDGKNALNVRTFAAISSIHFGFKYLAKLVFDKYGENSSVYICPMRLTTNEVESLFNQVRGDDHDNLPQYPNTLASILCCDEIKDAVAVNDANTNNGNLTTAQYRQQTTNYMIHEANNQ
eukprot:171945_1